MSMVGGSVQVNGRQYDLPSRPVVVICLDGSADEYFDAAMARGRMPNLQAMSVNGWRGMARAAMPTFTNVNNSCIVTGVPPIVHGIAGNFFLDPDTGEEVMMNSARFLRVETIFPAMQRAGRRVAVVTAKEKLRDIFASGLIELGGIAFSSEKAKFAARETHGIEQVESLVGPTPEIYSGDASLYVLQAGEVLLEKGMADFLYLSTTDYMQHAYGPERPEALDFYEAIDRRIGRLLDLGAIVGITADHGMNAKQDSDGQPNVIYLESELEQTFGTGFRVILPITDPYVVHHGALGSFAQVHVPPFCDLEQVRQWVLHRVGITECHDRETAARLMELPADRIGDLVVASGRDVVLGRTPEDHDLNSLVGGLRSHGGRYEEMVPLMFSHPVKPSFAARVAGDVRNFDVFELTCSGLQWL
jgi:phosphonoacetate hydrolase